MKKNCVTTRKIFQVYCTKLRKSFLTIDSDSKLRSFLSIWWCTTFVCLTLQWCTEQKSNRPEVFCIKGVQNSQENIFVRVNKVSGFRPATLLKKSICQNCSPVNFTNFLRTYFYMGQLRWLLLNEDLRKWGGKWSF